MGQLRHGSGSRCGVQHPTFPINPTENIDTDSPRRSTRNAITPNVRSADKAQQINLLPSFYTVFRFRDWAQCPLSDVSPTSFGRFVMSPKCQ